MPKLTLVTGGSRSGKSVHALELANERVAGHKYFVATAQPIDDEMRSRIAHHRRSRPPEFHTVEEPIALTAVLASINDRAAIAVIDCLTLWVSNLMQAEISDDAILAEADALVNTLREVQFRTIVVSDEVGAGIVPDHPAGRRFRDLLGWTNQRVARAADSVILMVAGYPMSIKKPPPF